jgi:hypothetical protein
VFEIDKFKKLGYQEKTIQDLLKEIDSVGIPIITENLNWVNLINNTNKLQIKSLSITNTKQVISHLTKYAPSDIVTLYKKIDKKILHMQSKRESINSDSIIKTANIVIEEWNKSHPGETDIPNIQISI